MIGTVLIKVVVISCKVKRKAWSWNLSKNKLWLSWLIFKSFSGISFLVSCLYFPTLRGWNVCIVSSRTVVNNLQQLRESGQHSFIIIKFTVASLANLLHITWTVGVLFGWKLEPARLSFPDSSKTCFLACDHLPIVFKMPATIGFLGCHLYNVRKI